MVNPDLEGFRLKVREYRLLVNRNQSDLAAYLNLDYNELSNRLNANKNIRLSHDNVRGIVRALAEWDAITTQSQAEELLDLMLCPHFDQVDLQAKPLSKLVVSPVGILPLTTAFTITKSIPQPKENSKSATSQTQTQSTSSPVPLHNLPRQLSSFIGRHNDIAELQRLLKQDQVRLLSLVGAGGCGKTRLALQVASELVDNFQDGIWFVELAPLSNSALIVQTIANILGLSEQSHRPILATLSDYLQSRHLLLVLDNCEHMVEECARIVENLLHTSTNLQILTTSREALGLNGETTFLVPSLTVPGSQQMPEVEILLSYEAVRLFLERARAVNPHFTLTQGNGQAVMNLCRQLDGIPLAIELAAARLKVLPVEQIAARLEDRLRFLTGGNRTALPRQQTLRALVDWSYDLLSPAEKKLFSNLSVFAGNWTLEAAEAVCSKGGSKEGLDAYETLDALSGLVNKSLVQVSQFKENTETRYSFLETIRQYSLDIFKATSEEGEIRKRHLIYFTALAEELGLKLLGPEQVETFQRLDRELENVRVAISFGQSLEKSEKLSHSTPNLFLSWDIGGHYSSVFQLVANLFYYWDLRGYYSEGRRYCEQILTLPTVTGVSRAMTLFFGGFLAMRQGDLMAARLYFEEGLVLSKDNPDEELFGYAFTCMGLLNHLSGNYEDARHYLEEALPVHLRMLQAYEASPKRNPVLDLKVPFYKASSQGNLAALLIELGDFVEGRRLSEESLTTLRELGNRWAVTLSLLALTRLALIEKDYPQADRNLAEVLDLSEAIGFRMGKLEALVLMGVNLYHQDKFKEARQYLDEGLVMSLKVDEMTVTVVALVVVAGLLSKIWLKQQAGLIEQVAQLSGSILALQASREQALVQPFRTYYEEAQGIAKSGMTANAFKEAFARGQAMSLEKAIDYARQALAEI